MNRKQKIIISFVGITIVLLGLVGLTYGYFLTQISGNENPKSISVTTANLELEYQDGTAEFSTGNVNALIYPGFVYAKQFSVENTGNVNETYRIILDNIESTFTRNDWKYYLYTGTYTIENYKTGIDASKLVTEGKVPTRLEEKSVVQSIEIEPGSANKDNYTLVIVYGETNTDQSIDMNKTLSLRVNIADNGVSMLAREHDLSTENYYAFMNNISEIHFVNHTYHGSNTIDCDDDSDLKWCIGDTEAGAEEDDIIAWLEESDADTSPYFEDEYILYIGSVYKIYAPENSSGLFAMLGSLNEITFDNFDTSNVTNMSWIFEYCTSLTEIDLSSFDTSNVTDMTWMFYGCSALKTIDLSSFDTSKVTNMSEMFFNMPFIQTLDLSSFDTSNVTDMSYMFAYDSFTTLDLSNFDISKVTNMEGMFGWFVAETIDFSNLVISSITNMEGIFVDAYVTTIYLNDTASRTKLTPYIPSSASFSTKTA